MALYNNRSLEYQLVKRYRELGKTEQFIWDAFDEAREFLPLSRIEMKRALKKYDFLQRVRHYNLHNAKHYKIRVRERIKEKLETAIEDIWNMEPSTIVLRVSDTRIRGFVKICSNCGEQIKLIKTANIKYLKMLMGSDDGERVYVPAEREESIFYVCENCGATPKR